MAIKWTNSQLDAINAKGSVIVTAAAGSGKTAVLVERVIERLCDDENPVSADRLLIVTFTKAAAAEMRQRIEKRLSQKIDEQPNNTNLLRQQLLISSADICTIDSFCIKLLRSYFSELGISPDFKIADPIIEEKIKRKTAEGIFNKRFEATDKEFISFLNAFDSTYGEQNAISALLELYKFTSILPQSNRWIERVKASYSVTDAKESEFFKAVIGWMLNDLPNVIKEFKIGIEETEQDPLLYEKIGELQSTFYDYLCSLNEACLSYDYNAVCALIKNPPASFPSLRSPKYDAEILINAKTSYKQAENWVAGWQNCFAFDDTAFLKELVSVKPVIDMLCDLHQEFSFAYREELDKRSFLTFSLVEQLALSLLTKENEKGDLVPSKLAEDIISLYDEVMVDEFQDVNNLQSYLFNIISDNGKKLFVVGDAKQSIYGFRGANPEHFLNKSNSADIFNEDIPKDTLKRVILSKNFRSRKQICEFVNEFFKLLMSKDFGGITYDENEALNNGATFTQNNLPAIEGHLLTSAEELSSAESEAVFVANYIKNTVAEPPFLRGKDNTLRQANYGDFAILLRKSFNFSVFVKTFKEFDIPVSLGYGDFFKTAEIKMIISFLKAISNPLDDMNLLGVLMSLIFGFAETEVALLKADSSFDRFYHAILKSEDKKCKFFVERFNFWRKKSASMSVGDFVSFLIADSNLNSLVLSMDEGERRLNNLLLFEELAAGYPDDVTEDISGFLNFLEFLKEAGDIKSQSSKNNNSVRLMTMHMSKGLQFPITIIGDSFGMFSRRETTQDIAFHNGLGIVINPVDDENNIKVKTTQKEIVNSALLRKQWEEELRLLYVAMTRAEERLVFVLTASSFKTKIKTACGRVLSGVGDNGVLNSAIAKDCNSIGDWLLIFLLLLPQSNDLWKEADLTRPKNRLKNLESQVVINKAFAEEIYNTDYADDKSIEKSIATNDYTAELGDIFKYKYPFEELREIEIKTSVSALTKRSAGREFCATSKPAFLSSGGLTPTERGTALHKFMQYADFNLAKINAKAEIERLYEYEYISRAEADAIDINRVEKFIKSDIFARILKAGKLYREQRFMLSVKAGELYNNLSDFAKDKSVIVQGAVDCMFVENNSIVLIDFKTDRTNDEEFLLKHYAEQLKTYCRAAEKMLGLSVSECYIYSLHMSKKIEVEI